MAPMERLHQCERPSVLQGGGVYIRDGTVGFQECNIYGNLALYVSARAIHIRFMAPMNCPHEPTVCVPVPRVCNNHFDLPRRT